MNPQERDTKVRVEFSSQAIVLPPEAPQLGFIVIGCSTHTQWLQEQPCPGKTARLQSVVGQVLSLASSGGDAGATSGTDSGKGEGTGAGEALRDSCRVWAPKSAHEAITDGLVQWLRSLHSRVGIASYCVNPCALDRDVIEITLQLQSGAVRQTLFLLRRHQVGHQGIAIVLTSLHALTPTLVGTGLPN
jgi:hypothetical protein